MVAEGVVPEGDPTKSTSSKSVEMDAALGDQGDGSRPFTMPEILVDLKDGGETTAGNSAFLGGNGLRSIGAEGSRKVHKSLRSTNHYKTH